MLNWLYREALIPAFETVAKGRRTHEYWAELEKSQWWSRPELERVQLGALQRLLIHAQDHCPYYGGAWRELGLDARKAESPSDFERWPVLERDTVSANRNEMRARVPGVRLLPKATGGTSGAPLRFDLDMGSYERRMAAYNRGYAWAGAAPGTKQWWLWGVTLGERPRWREWKDDLYFALYRRKLVSSFGLSDETMPVYFDSLRRRRPEVIVAYTNALYYFAQMIRERGLKPFSPKSIVVGGEKLHAHQRALIEETFDAPVFETYGSREFMLMGAECSRHEGLHLTTEQILIEVVDPDGSPTPPGKEGDLVVTDLFNYGMPFVRYRNGDRAIAGLRDCACGRGLPLLREVTGRVVDTIVTPDGRRLPGLFFPHLFKDFAAVKRFQVVQQAPDRVTVRLVLAPAGAEDRLPELERACREALGPQVAVAFERVESIELTAAGKYRPVVAARTESPGR